MAGRPCIEADRHRERGWKITREFSPTGGEEIHISGGKLVVKVRGSGLELRSMNASQLLITGVITAVELE